MKASPHDPPNTLFIGYQHVAEIPAARLAALGDGLHVCPLPGALRLPPTCSALVLEHVGALRWAQQRELLVWMEREPRVPVWSLSPAPLFPLVEDGRFDARLYYRLNVIIERAAPDVAAKPLDGRFLVERLTTSKWTHGAA
jgi:hypothetical protein